MIKFSIGVALDADLQRQMDDELTRLGVPRAGCSAACDQAKSRRRVIEKFREKQLLRNTLRDSLRGQSS